VPFDPNKPATGGPLSSAEIRENFRALKEDRIVDAGYLEGLTASAFVTRTTPALITAVHTFNPSTAGAPFILGANAQGQLITGLNADMLDGKHDTDFASASHTHTDFPRRYTSNIVVTVGSGGDFSTINEALDYIVNTYAPYARSNGQSLSVEIKLKSGFVMQEQVFVRGHDLSWITITAEDSEVNVDADYLTTPLAYKYPAFCAYEGGTLPVIGCLFSMINSDYGKRGIFLYKGARCYIKTECGFKNADINLELDRNCIAIGDYAYFDGALQYGILSERSYISINNAKCRNCGDNGIYLIDSFAVIPHANLQDCGDNGLYCVASFAIAYGSSASGGQYGFKLAYGSIVNGYNSNGTVNVTPNTISANGIFLR